MGLAGVGSNTGAISNSFKISTPSGPLYILAVGGLMERCITGSIMPRNPNNSKERGWIFFFFSWVQSRMGAKMLTMRPAPRWPILGSGLFSIIRTGTPFLSKVRASISPTGPAPTYASRLIKHRKLVDIDQKKSRTIRTCGGVARAWGICEDMMEEN